MRRLLLAALLLAAPGLAQAHSRSESHMAWEIADRLVRVTVTLPEQEARRIDPAARDASIATYLLPRLGATAEGTTCTPQAPPTAIPASPGFRRFEMAFACPVPRGIALRSDAFFDLVPTHVSLARIRTTEAGGEARFAEQLFTTDQRLLLATPAEGTLASAPFHAFLLLGVEHILTGPDHIAFLLGLLLLSRGLRDLAWVITGFTLGHSITLGLAVTGLVRPDTGPIDALIALSIAVIGAENVVQATRRSRPVALAAGALLLGMAALRLLGLGGLPLSLLLGAALFTACYLLLVQAAPARAPLRAGIAACFGLVHGFAFARDLVEMGLPPARLAELLLGFNLGVEIGQLLLVGLVWMAVRGLSRLGLAPSRRLVVDWVAPALTGLGVFWLVSRSYGAGG
ncbi:HupE/UreJ family protein [Falsiroseomonas ponticola]|uniref:HupE/UreJ family protein n=1 Tax=Falsiroseomonas ponticola TaxID=2786951 RepID=UPI001934A4A1|nr:HupE/UreJ family protein [Roseomonas ponticola]